MSSNGSDRGELMDFGPADFWPGRERFFSSKLKVEAGSNGGKDSSGVVEI